MKSDSVTSPNTHACDALILVDLQNDFLPGGSLAVPQGDEVIPVANKLQTQFEIVFASRDWHPANHGSFASNHPGTQPGDVGELGGLPQVFWPDHCIQHTRGAEFAASLDDHATRQEVFKGQQVDIDSYSAFFDNGHQHQTQLDALLRSGNVKRLFIMGLATDYCVKFTALDAVGLGYETYLVVDGCRGVNQNPNDTEHAIADLQQAGVVLIDAEQVSKCRLKTNPAASVSADDTVVAESAFLRLKRAGNWDYVERTKGTGVVAIAALTSNREVILIEQYRPPVKGRVIEMPAGVVGDIASDLNELPASAASRELLEETGYEATKLIEVHATCSSAGLTNEEVTFFLANDAKKVAAGGGDESESITVHTIPLGEVDSWLENAFRAGKHIDARVYTGLYFLGQHQAG